MSPPARRQEGTANGATDEGSIRSRTDTSLDRGYEWPLAVSEVQWRSPEGQELVRRDGVPFPPALYIDGVLAGYGRLSEGRLRRVLKYRPSP